MRRDETQRRHTLIKYVGLTALALLIFIPSTALAVSSVTSPDGSAQYVCNSNGTVSVIDTATNNIVTTITLARGMPYMDMSAHPHALVITPDGSKVYVAGGNIPGYVYVIDTATNTRIAVLDTWGMCPYNIAISPDGNRVYVTNVDSYSVAVIDTTTDTTLACVRVGKSPDAIIVTPDNSKVYVPCHLWGGGIKSGIYVIDATKNTLAKIIEADLMSSTGYIEISGNLASFGGYTWDITTDTLINQKVTITWNFPESIIYGTALNDTQLNAVAINTFTGEQVPGQFVYNPPSGTVLNAGWQLLYVDFTPTDITSYKTASYQRSINVLKATPTITWTKPADIIYGTPLGSTQLNASASVPGTFVYTPASGTILSAGTQTLKVDFTPTDTANYNSVPQTTTINVLTCVQKIQQITTKVQSLNLAPEQANLLIVKLDTATKNLNNGNTLGAATELNAFTNQVNAYISNGKISLSEGQSLIDNTNDLIKAMNNVFNYPAKSVPEFPSVALPIVSILGLILIFGRKKND